MGIVEIVGIREVAEYCMTNLRSWTGQMGSSGVELFLFENENHENVRKSLKKFMGEEVRGARGTEG